MQLKSLLLPLSLATTVLADGASIIEAISSIQNQTLALGSTISSWDGNLLSTLPIIVDSTTLLSVINEGTETAQDSANLTVLEAAKVYLATNTLVKNVNATLETVMATKPKFDKLLLSPVILLNLELEKSASADFSAAVVSKLPESLQATGDALAAKIEDLFAEAIAVYNPFD